MPVKEFWHGDRRLLRAYQTAYIRHNSYSAWVNGQYNSIAIGIALQPSEKHSKKPKIPYPKWEDPIKKEKETLSQEEMEREYRRKMVKELDVLRKRFLR